MTCTAQLIPFAAASFVSGLLLLAGAKVEAEEPPEGAVRGRIPIWGIGIAGGGGLRSYTYSSAGRTDEESSLVEGFWLGPGCFLSVDLHNVVLLGTGTLSLLEPHSFETQAGLLVGARSWVTYNELVDFSVSQSGGARETKYTVHAYHGIYHPRVIGVYAGGAVLGFAEATDSDFGRTRNVPASSRMMIEAGLGVVGSGRFLLSAVHDPESGDTGGRMRGHFRWGTGNFGAHMGIHLLFIPGTLLVIMDVGFGDGIGAK
jgi:hypothetical protein